MSVESKHCRRLGIVLLALTGTGFGGCDRTNKTDGLTPPRSDPSIREARAVLAKMIAAWGKRPDLGRMEGILGQPDFSGVLQKWGCLAFFDDAGRLVAAQTLNVVDFRTGARNPVRQYTTSELSEARDQILAYQKTLGTDPTMAFPIFSESLRLAVAAAVTNEDARIQFALGREAEQMQVTKMAGNSQTVVASDALYAMKRRQTHSGSGQVSFELITQWEFTASAKAVVEAVSIALTPDGNVVVPIPGDGAVRIYTAEGRLLKELGGLAVPAGVAVDGFGNLFVVESRGPSFRKYSASSTSYTLSGGDLGRDRLRYPTGIAINKQGHVYIGDKALEKILEFDNEGAFVRDMSSTDGPPAILAWGPTKGLIAQIGGELVRFSSEGKEIDRLSLDGCTPVGIAYDPKGQLLVTSLEGHLYALDPSGTVAGPMRIDTDLGVPFAVAGTQADAIFVYDIRGLRILVLGANNRSDRSKR